jgi:hypothetical protein
MMASMIQCSTVQLFYTFLRLCCLCATPTRTAAPAAALQRRQGRCPSSTPRPAPRPFACLPDPRCAAADRRPYAPAPPASPRAATAQGVAAGQQRALPCRAVARTQGDPTRRAPPQGRPPTCCRVKARLPQLPSSSRKARLPLPAPAPAPTAAAAGPPPKPLEPRAALTGHASRWCAWRRMACSVAAEAPRRPSCQNWSQRRSSCGEGRRGLLGSAARPPPGPQAAPSCAAQAPAAAARSPPAGGRGPGTAAAARPPRRRRACRTPPGRPPPALRAAAPPSSRQCTPRPPTKATPPPAPPQVWCAG